MSRSFKPLKVSADMGAGFSSLFSSAGLAADFLDWAAVKEVSAIRQRKKAQVVFKVFSGMNCFKKRSFIQENSQFRATCRSMA